MDYSWSWIQDNMKKEKRNNRIEVVLNEEEKDRIVKLAGEVGLPISTFIRYKILLDTGKIQEKYRKNMEVSLYRYKIF